jgi:electron transport complex protein RnfD
MSSKGKEDRIRLVISSSPHISKGTSVERIMFTVVLCLMPALAASVYYFGYRVLAIVAVSVGVAILTELLAKRLRKKPFKMDGSAVVTGLILGLMMPPGLEWSQLWLPAVGALFAIAIVKEAFGGLGYNIWNPAAGGFLFCLLSWTGIMRAGWIGKEVVMSEATPLVELKKGADIDIELVKDLFLGDVNGALGETSALALLIGGLVLIGLRYIDWRIPLSFIGTVGLLTYVVRLDPTVTLAYLFAGGLFLGAFFMATDYVTSPLTGWGKVLFGVGAGILVAVIRLFASGVEGVAYSILFMNMFTPLIDRFIRTEPFGMVKKKEEAKG